MNYLKAFSLNMTDYDHTREPTYITEQIFDYIDDVMCNGCEWTFEKILSQDTFESTICKTCKENRKNLLDIHINYWQLEYDYDGIITRGVTPYKELPRVLKMQCQAIALEQAEMKYEDIYDYTQEVYERKCNQSEVVDLKISNAINERNIRYLMNQFERLSRKCITKDLMY